MVDLDTHDDARSELAGFVARTLPDAVEIADHSWPNGESIVVEYRTGQGMVRVAKRHLTRRSYVRESAALRDWAPRLGPGRAPTLFDSDDDLKIIITDRLPGAAGTADTPDAYRQAGELTRILHGIDVRGTQPDQAARMSDQIEEWLRRAPGVFSPADVDFIHGLVRQADRLADPGLGSIHNDNQPRNWIVDQEGKLAMIDFGRAQIDLYLRDFERMTYAEWIDRPDFAEAFFDGYGRRLTDDDEAMITCRGAIQGMGTVIWSREHDSPEYEQHGWRILDRVRSQSR